MTTDDRWLELADEPARHDCDTFVGRLLSLDAAVLVRLQRGPGTVSVWAGPGGSLVRRDVPGRLGGPDLTVAAAPLRAVLTSGRVALPPSADAEWRDSLPPRAGWTLVDDVPVAVLRELAGRTDRPDDVVLTVDAEPTAGPAVPETSPVGVPLRLITALDRLGFLPAGAGEVVRVATTPAWARLATRLGTAYDRRAGRTLGLR